MSKKILIFIPILMVISLVVACRQSDQDEQPGSETTLSEEPVFVYWDCEDTYVETGKEIAIYYEWATITNEQNEEYFDVTDHYISMNGVPMEIIKEEYGGIQEMEDGTFHQAFWMNIGTLEPGKYEITTAADITEPVFDGWDWYGPDTEYESLSSSCTITVGDEPAPEVASADEKEPPTYDVPELPTPTSSSCSITSSIKQDWNTYLCETFESGTELWTGNRDGTSVFVQNGEYIIDNSTKVAQGYTTGFIFPIKVGSGEDYLISVDGYMESKYRNCTWGIFVRSVPNEIIYFFMINNEGRYTLTGSTDQEANRYLGNIKTGSHNAIIWDGVNNISALVDGTSMDFYVNDELLASHEAINAVNPDFGLIVWGGEGVSTVNHIDNLLVRVK